MKEERIAKIIAHRGLCSRREAERLIAAGLVLVDGIVVRDQGSKAAPDAAIAIAPAGTVVLEAKATVVLNKPVGIVSTQPEPGQVPAWTLLRRDTAEGEMSADVLARILARPESLSVAGRLDRASRGLLILTQDGAVARRIIGGHFVEKVYLVRTAEPVTDAQLRKLRGRQMLDDQPLLPMRVERVADQAIRLGLREGRKHQIRRLCRRVGLTVIDLFREAVGPFRLGSLPEGHWRPARPDELERLQRSTEETAGG